MQALFGVDFALFVYISEVPSDAQLLKVMQSPCSHSGFPAEGPALINLPPRRRPMSLPRFFIDLPSNAFRMNAPFELPPKAAHHAGRALRLSAGERVELFNGSGTAWQGAIGFSADRTWVDIDAATEGACEPPVFMTLVQSFVSPEKTDWIVEKAVETGVSAVRFVPAERSVTRLSGERLAKRLARLTDIARAAAEQCGRNLVPEITASPSLAAGLAAVAADVRLILAPGAKGGVPAEIRPGLRSAAFAVGPEGGFSAAEIEAAEAAGWRPTLLGARVLRTETAGLAAACWLETLAGDYPRRE